MSDEKKLIGIWLYHKKIINISDLKKEESLVFAEKEYADIPHEVFCKAYQTNPLFKGGQAVIWGTGKNGKVAYEILTDAGMKVMCFIDTNKEIYDKYFEMDRKVQECCPHIRQRFYCDVHSMLVLYKEQGRILLNLDVDKWDLLKLHRKKVYIYGTREDESEISCYLKLLDYHVVTYLSDNDDMKSNMDDGYSIMPVADLLYEDKYAVYVHESETKREKILKRVGCMP